MEYLRQRFELARGLAGTNLRSMEGLRGIAVFLVFLVHFRSSIQAWLFNDSPTAIVNNAFGMVGNTGVDLFFVLSGYLIYASLMKRQQAYGSFIGRRIRRIYPTFFVIFMAYLGLSIIFPAESKIPSGIAAATLYFIQNLLFLPGMLPIEPMITVAWSLSYEVFYYLIMPLIVLAIGLRAKTPQWRIGFFSIVGVILTAICIIWQGPLKLAMFIAGILLHELLESKRNYTPTAWLGLLGLLVGTCAPLLPLSGMIGNAIRFSLIFSGFLLACWHCFSQAESWLKQALSWTPLRWLGNMSYSYYLVHGLSLHAGFMLLQKFMPATPTGGWFFWLILPLMFGVTLVSGALLFVLVEHPMSLKSASKPVVVEETREPEVRPTLNTDAA
ncbi:acyltransferase family protein [Herpetosiphon giganteus]|uniref:acyltransferase family protein n=1 Tax=Herpetosiphon giganteus TaxID=2029754 RepID=UPI00195B96F3|nr:acyltransferase [Herpetosiphon giganteus]MBM7846421.1 peptidoglycan/LPS O-acetylase OafA/YrhL [Herpetosiphon giganteus]